MAFGGTAPPSSLSSLLRQRYRPLSSSGCSGEDEPHHENGSALNHRTNTGPRIRQTSTRVSDIYRCPRPEERIRMAILSGRTGISALESQEAEIKLIKERDHETNCLSVHLSNYHRGCGGGVLRLYRFRKCKS